GGPEETPGDGPRRRCPPGPTAQGREIARGPAAHRRGHGRMGRKADISEVRACSERLWGKFSTCRCAENSPRAGKLKTCPTVIAPRADLTKLRGELALFK